MTTTRTARANIVQDIATTETNTTDMVLETLITDTISTNIMTDTPQKTEDIVIDTIDYYATAEDKTASDIVLDASTTNTNITGIVINTFTAD